MKLSISDRASTATSKCLRTWAESEDDVISRSYEAYLIGSEAALYPYGYSQGSSDSQAEHNETEEE